MLTRSLATAATRLARNPATRVFSTTPAVRSLTNLFEAGDNPPLSISKLNHKGFVLSDGLVIPGGAIFAEGRVLLWDVDPPIGDGMQGVDKAWEGWTEERFAVFERMVPRPGECEQRVK